MCTTFGILIPTTNEVEEIAHRYNSEQGKVMITIKDPLIHLFPKETELIPLDNTSQGIFTINDLLNQWKNNGK